MNDLNFYYSQRVNFFKKDPAIKKFMNLRMQFINNDLLRVEEHEIFKMDEFKGFKE